MKIEISWVSFSISSTVHTQAIWALIPVIVKIIVRMIKWANNTLQTRLKPTLVMLQITQSSLL